MKDGVVVETGTTEQIFDWPQRDCTKALLAAALNLETVKEGAVRT